MHRKVFGEQNKTNLALNCIFSVILTVIKSFWVELISTVFSYLEVYGLPMLMERVQHLHLMCVCLFFQECFSPSYLRTEKLLSHLHNVRGSLCLSRWVSVKHWSKTLCEGGIAILRVKKVGCDKELGRQGPVGEEEHSFTRDVERNVIFQLQKPQRLTYCFNILVLSRNTLRIYFFMLKCLVSGYA